MKKSTVIIAIVLPAILIGIALWAIGLAAPVLAQDLGDRVERRLDKKEDRIDNSTRNDRVQVFGFFP